MAKILVHLHLYYFDMWKKMKRRLRAFGDRPYDLFITMPRDYDAMRRRILAFKPDADISVVKNVGADIWPFLSVLNRINIDRYDYVAKIHTKRKIREKSYVFDNLTLYGWRFFRFATSFLASRRTLEKCIAALDRCPELGMIGDWRLIRRTTTTSPQTIGLYSLLNERAGFEPASALNFKEVVGTMFFARAKIMKAAKNLGLSESDFAPFRSNSDGTMAHAMENFFGIAAADGGYEIRDVYTPIWKKIFQSIINAATPPILVSMLGIKNIGVSLFPRRRGLVALSFGFGGCDYGFGI